MAKILFTEHNFCPETPVRLIEAGHEVDIVKEEVANVHEFDRTALLATLKDSQPDVLVVGFKFQIDKEVLDSAPIKAIFTRTTGLDHIDLNYCKERGIEVVPLYGSELTDVVAVPELIILKTLELLRKDKKELKDKTFGIIGHGRIGKILGEYVVSLGAELSIYDDNRNGITAVQIVEKVGFKCPWWSLERVLSTSDVLSLNISSTEENRGFFDREKFDLMKQGSYFLNSARPWLVDNQALKDNLESGKLAGAWSDFPVSFEHPKLLVTNHIGGKTLESSQKTEVIIVNKLLEWLKSH